MCLDEGHAFGPAIRACLRCRSEVLASSQPGPSGEPTPVPVAPAGNGLSFATLRAANIARLPTMKNRHGGPAHAKPDGSDWSPAQWLQALAGEVGEYANVRKKYERGDLTGEEFQEDARKELADIMAYLDLLAFQLGIDLGAATVSKFNEVSDRVSSPIRLALDGSSVLREEDDGNTRVGDLRWSASTAPVSDDPMPDDSALYLPPTLS